VGDERAGIRRAGAGPVGDSALSVALRGGFYRAGVESPHWRRLHAALDCGAADVGGPAAAAGLREGARATVEGAAAAVGNHPAVRALGGACGGGAARAERLLAWLDAYPGAAALIGPTRLAVRYAGARACDTPPDDDEGSGEHRDE